MLRICYVAQEVALLRTPQDTATAIAVILKRSGQTRAQISEKTFRYVSKRQRLKAAFIVATVGALSENYGWTVNELDIGGYGAVQTKILETSKSVTAEKYMTSEEKKALRKADFDFTDWEIEAQSDAADLEED